MQDKFRAFTNLNYAGQAKAFLNAFWGEHGSTESDRIWDVYNVFVEIDFENKKEGRDLDEFGAHRVLEKFGETRSVKAMRDELRAVDMDFNKRVALLEYLLFTFGHTVEEFVARPQDASEELRAAQEAVEAAQSALADAVAALDASEAAASKAASEAATAAASAEEARTKAVAAQAAADDANNKAAAAQAAEAELKAALDSLQAQEEAFETQKETLRQKSTDQSTGVVTRNKAANELAQLEATDPLPLRQAKIDTGAATRKAEKARIEADASAAQANAAAESAARAQAEADADAEAAENSRVAAEAAAEDARASAAEMENKFAEAESQLSALAAVSGGSSGQGAIWWMERELAEAKKYAPRRR
jgi:hypothetical protein